MFSDPILAAQIQRDEGREACAYKDTKGLWTIGDGILVDRRVPGAGLRPEEMDFILENRLRIASVQAMNVYGRDHWDHLNGPRRRALANLCHNLGASEFAKFQRTLNFMRQGEFAKAADNIVLNKWARDVGEGRSSRVAAQIRTGIDQP